MTILFELIKKRLRSNPTGLYVLFYTEMWELFGRFGITALLVLYLTRLFHLPDATAFAIYSAFMALIYATPLVGGVLADRYLGSRNAVILGATLMIIGNALMVFPALPLVYVGLSIVTVGFGFFLPSIPPILGALYEKQEAQRDAGFTVYYLGKNLGGLLAPLACGFVGEHYGYNYAFILSSIGMASGLLVFVLGQKHLKAFYRKAPAENKHKRVLGAKPKYQIVMIAIAMMIGVYFVLQDNVQSELLLVSIVIVCFILGRLYVRSSADERKPLRLIFLSMLAVILFVAILNTGGTTLNLFVERIVDRHVLGTMIPTPAFYALDPIFMLMLGPLIAALWVKLSKTQYAPLFTTKFAIAFLVFGLGFIVFVCAAQSAILHGSASPMYVVAGYFLFPIAELCIVPISLSMTTKLAPRGKETLLVSVWMLCNAVASFLTGLISKSAQIKFNIDSKATVIKASHVYSSLFLDLALALFAAAVIFFILRFAIKQYASSNVEVSNEN